MVPKSQAALKQSYAPVVKKAVPAVVNVYVSRRVSQRVSPFMNDPFFQRFFRDFGMPRERVQNSLGSGVIVGDEGIVVTNNHVIEGSGEAEITVALSDGREFPAEIILKDDRTDLAVLRLDAKGEKFRSVAFADSDSLQVGDIVLAIGDPFGVGQTVTSGIVSALARTQVGISDYQFFIQTDAAINPGNSGGALIDMDGHLVGINTAIFSKSGGSHGIGFAIPSNMVRLVVKAALEGGTVRRPWLGASLQPVTSQLADTLGLKSPRGALVNEINAAGPGAKAGLQVGDVVLSVDGMAVKDPQALQYRLVTKGIGGTATLGVMRDGRAQDVTLKLVPAAEVPPRNEKLLEGRTPLTGAKVANLSPAVAEELDLANEGPGVVVMDVTRGTVAARVACGRAIS
ncbi:Periplasmic serine endoprotease DegP precursor [Methyloligella halotolerans]|uniref:Periplasmic serine endoprotease DegP n=1 Tax=Methyloligella halotolerans TaxID=1177755 RepID=A0A1E2S1Q9_9HYPH|nr:Periplasmic serine endoprotease DegP precursor [Methyloligella halotolerans]